MGSARNGVLVRGQVQCVVGVGAFVDWGNGRVARPVSQRDTNRKSPNSAGLCSWEAPPFTAGRMSRREKDAAVAAVRRAIRRYDRDMGVDGNLQGRI